MMKYTLLIVFVASTSVCRDLALADSAVQKIENHDIPTADAATESITTPTSESIQPNCGENEVVHHCTTSYCLKKFCYQDDIGADCIYRETCYPGCICKEGYLMERNFTCVPVDQCYKPNLNITCGENEIVSKCANGGCDRSYCSQIGEPPFCRDIFAGYCEPGCVCKSDYLRAANGSCVPIDECPKNEYCTKPHEYYDPCSPRCPSEQCSEYISRQERPNLQADDCPPQPKPGDPTCYGECRCEEGYYRNYNQDCVPSEDCSISCFGRNEMFVAYPESCEPQTCDGVSTTEDQTTGKACRSACRCLPGFVRNKQGECIAKENCGKCQGPNEHFSCSSGCDNICSTLDKIIRTNCPTADNGYFWGNCVDKCYCDDGFARDSQNTCVPVSDCPNPSA